MPRVDQTASPSVKRSDNLRFLLNPGLINNSTVRRRVKAFLDTRRPGNGPALPSAAGAGRLVSRFEGAMLRPYTDAAGLMVVGSSHALTGKELRTGTIVIAGKAVAFRDGITQAQADRLLRQDLQPCGERSTGSSRWN